jgi:hypothetical protein
VNARTSARAAADIDIYIGAPAVIQLVIVDICADVRQARIDGHSSGMRAFVQPLSEAMITCAMTLLATSFGTISVRLVQADMVRDPFGLALTMRP